jgi:prevent-host-death family protein
VDRIGIRELNQHTSTYITRVKAGHTIEITERGKPVARLVPVEQGNSYLDRMIAAGEVEPATGDLLEILDSLPAMEPDGIDLAAVLSEMREEERY